MTVLWKGLSLSFRSDLYPPFGLGVWTTGGCVGTTLDEPGKDYFRSVTALVLGWRLVLRLSWKWVDRAAARDFVLDRLGNAALDGRVLRKQVEGGGLKLGYSGFYRLMSRLEDDGLVARTRAGVDERGYPVTYYYAVGPAKPELLAQGTPS